MGVKAMKFADNVIQITKGVTNKIKYWNASLTKYIYMIFKNTIPIHEAADLPGYGSGTITFTGGKTYKGFIPVESPLVVSDNIIFENRCNLYEISITTSGTTTIQGSFEFVLGEYKYTGTGNMFNISDMNGKVIRFEKCNLVAQGDGISRATMWNIDYTTAGYLLFREVNMIGHPTKGFDFGIIKAGTVIVNTAKLFYYYNGLAINDGVETILSNVAFGIGLDPNPGVPLLEFSGAAHNTILLDNIIFNQQTRYICYNFPTATNFGSVVASGGSVTDSTEERVFATGSYTQRSIGFNFSDTAGIVSSTSTVELKVSDNTKNTQVTNIPANDIPVMINSNKWNSSTAQKISIDSNGVITNDDVISLIFDITSPLNVEPESPALNKDITVYLGYIDCEESKSCTFTNSTNTVNSTGHGLSNGDQVSFYNTTGTLPAELRTDIFYYIINSGVDSFQVSYTSGGAAVTFTDDGTPPNIFEESEMIGINGGPVTASTGKPIAATAVSLKEFCPDGQLVQMVSSADATNVVVASGGSKVRRA
jgi:hypothetical protein